MKPRSWSRRRFLAAAAGGVGAVAAAEGLWFQPRRLTVTRHDIGEPVVGRAPIRLVQLSDLHLKSFGSVQRRVVEEVGRLEADVIVLSGDAIDSVAALSELEAFLAALPPEAIRIATLGNWEYWGGLPLNELRALYRAHDCSLLINESEEVVVDNVRARVVGLDDWLAGTPDLERAADGTDVDERSIVVAHCPAWHDEAGARTIHPAATLSGHTHGGQIAAGSWAPFRPPGSGSYVSGWYREGGAPLYVSRGLGTSVLPVRLGAVPEIAVFDWHVAPSG